MRFIQPVILLYLLITCKGASAQEDLQRPGIGVTLSGGGAKGLAHIGISPMSSFQNPTNNLVEVGECVFFLPR